MSCYCGCGTTGNKVKWAVFGVCCALAVIFFALYVDHLQELVEDYEDCMQQVKYLSKDSLKYIEREQFCKDLVKNESQKDVALFFILFVVFAIASSIPLYVMCCCTKKPDEATVQVVPAVGYVTYQKL